jgi:hypothetical protein
MYITAILLLKLFSSLINHIYSLEKSFFHTHSDDDDDIFDGDDGDKNNIFLILLELSLIN